MALVFCDCGAGPAPLFPVGVCRPIMMEPISTVTASTRAPTINIGLALTVRTPARIWASREPPGVTVRIQLIVGIAAHRCVTSDCGGGGRSTRRGGFWISETRAFMDLLAPVRSKDHPETAWPFW